MSTLSHSETDASDRDGRDPRIYLPDAILDSDDTQYTVLDYHDLTLPLVNGRLVQPLNVHTFLRTLVDFALLHLLQLKALQKRELKLADLLLRRFGQHSALVVKLLLPKTTQVQYAACLRHKLVELCPHFVLAMYMFARCHIPDTYGKLDLGSAAVLDPQFLRYKLLNGSNKLRLLLYLQQYKALTKVLKILDEFKPVNLGKILTTQHNTDPQLGLLLATAPAKPLALAVELLLPDVAAQYAGFDSFEAYLVPRARKEPPAEVVRQIFPFIDSAEAQGPEFAEFAEVLRHLRVLLVQDMVEVKQRFPENLLCEHAIFSSPAFCKWAGVPNAPRREELNGALPLPEVASPALPTRLGHLEHLVATLQKQQHAMAQDLQRLVDTHAANAAKHSQALSNLINTTNGLLILLTLRNQNAAAYSRQVFANNTQQLEQLQRQMEHTQHEQLALARLWNTHIRTLEAMLGRYYTHGAKQKGPAAGLAAELGSVETLEDLWNDYKTWEQRLGSAGVSVAEWVRAHPLEARRAASRGLAVRLIEREAQREQALVYVVMARLKLQLELSVDEWAELVAARDNDSATGYT